MVGKRITPYLHTCRRLAIAFLAVGLELIWLSVAHAGPIVANVGFETVTPNPDGSGGNGQVNYWSLLPGWNTQNIALAFAVGPGQGDALPGLPSTESPWRLWGPLGASSPDGGNYLALCGETGYNGSLSQPVPLVPGAGYVLTFWWAVAQQWPYSGAASSGVLAAIAGASVTLERHIVAHGFGAWQPVTLAFTADTVNLLTVRAFSSGGEQPFTLLDGVRIDAVPVPEVSTIVLVLLGVAWLALRQAEKASARWHSRDVEED